MTAISENLGFLPLSPLLGCMLAYALGRRGGNVAGWIATIASTVAFAWVVKLFLALPHGTYFEDQLFTWFASGPLKVDFTLRFDALTAVMCLVVTGVGSLIHLYSIGYMAEDEGRARFFSYLNLFMFSMLLLVLGGNLLVLFVGWEGVGLCSYLLIGFWYKNLNYAAAGRKAFVVNRIGDLGFLIAIFLLFWNYGTVDFVQLSNVIGLDRITLIPVTVIAICLFVGACGKSAQIPLFVWLPDAMAGPTPVSALIHAATMVTAGIYMMARLHYLFDLAPFAQMVVALIAVLTAFVAGTTALAQNDIKKVLAYSTVSQLGFMFMAAACGAYWVAIFHLVTHAFFKACLFLGAGSVIHGCHHEQDMRHMGGLRSKMPITFYTYLFSTFAIAGIYPFAGYQSKHAILAALGENTNGFLATSTTFLVMVASMTAFITAFYMSRSVTMTFFGEYRGHAHPHESPWLMTIPLIILAILATVGGVLLAHPLQHYLAAVLPVQEAHHAETVFESILHSWVGISGMVLAFVLYTTLKEVPAEIYKTLGPLSRLLTRKYYFDEIYAALIVTPLQKFSDQLWKRADQVLIDGAVNGSAELVDISGEITRTMQTGQTRHYALFMFLGTIVVVLFYLVM